MDKLRQTEKAGAVQSIGDIIQAIARQRGRGDSSPLMLLRQIEGSAGERISHLPVEGELAQSWLALIGEPFRPHQAQALMALRRGDAVALRASSADVSNTSHLLLYASLVGESHAAALLLAPDPASALELQARLAEINHEMPASMRLSTTLVEPGRRIDPYARVVIATPEGLHARLLRHHDRAWQLFWAALRLLIIPDIHHYAGVAGAHLADLLLRLHRITAAHTSGAAPGVLATMVELNDPDPALATLLGQPWRVVNADDGPRTPTMLAIWRGSGNRLREATEIAIALQRQGYHIHIMCSPLEQVAIAPLISDSQEITAGPGSQSAQVIVTTGYPGSHSVLRRLLRTGYQAVIVTLGDLPHEQALARHVETLVSDPPTNWYMPPANAYVTAQHILCAASEQPLSALEVEGWGAQDIITRLAADGQLVDLPDTEVIWKPGGIADPYADFSLLAASGAAIIAQTEQGQLAGTLDPTNFERWTFPGAALPPGVGNLRVLARDEEHGTITLRIENNGRRTFPLRRCDVQVRDTRETRMLAGDHAISWGRVVINEEIYGFREALPNSAPAELTLKTPLTARWLAPACWFDLGVSLQITGQFVGWCLAAALPLRVLATFTDVTPCYDAELRRLYLIDAQPGGNGLANWTYSRAEALLPLAYDIALACRNDPLLEPLSRADMDWLLTLLGRGAPELTTTEQRPHQFDPAPPYRGGETRPRSEGAETNPRMILTPAPPPVPREERVPPPREERRTEPPREERVPPPRDERRTEPPRDERVPPPRDERRTPVAPPGPRTPEPANSDRSGNRTGPRRERAPLRPPERPAPASPSAQPPEPVRPSNANPPAKATPPEELPPDPAALIERLRRERQQREASQNTAKNRGAPTPANTPIIQRFKPGDRIFCLPYGDGTVRASLVENGREMLTVAFPDHGDLLIDPAISLVRKLEDAPEEDDLL